MGCTGRSVTIASVLCASAMAGCSDDCIGSDPYADLVPSEQRPRRDAAGDEFVPPQPNQAQRLKLERGEPFKLRVVQARPGKMILQDGNFWVTEASSTPPEIVPAVVSVTAM